MHNLNTLTPVTHKKYFVAYYPDHPNAWSVSKLIYWHRLVMENLMGRYLDSSEHIHHIDGDAKNNNPNNLRLISASEHVRIHKRYLERKNCLFCTKSFRPNLNKRKYCSPKCFARTLEKISWPNRENLKQLVWSMPCSTLSGLLGVSDSMIGKKCRALGIIKPGRGYWAKKFAKGDRNEN